LNADDISCPVLEVQDCGTTATVQRCTLQLHPDSTYVRPAIVLRATHRASITATDCKLVGPAPGNSSGIDTAATAEAHATICLVSAAAHVDGVQPANRGSCLQPCKHALRPCDQVLQALLMLKDCCRSAAVSQPASEKQAACSCCAHAGEMCIVATPGLCRWHSSRNQLGKVHWTQGHGPAHAHAGLGHQGTEVHQLQRLQGVQAACLWSSLRAQGAAGAQLRWQPRLMLSARQVPRQPVTSMMAMATSSRAAVRKQ
jgi:hypothetical protein